MLSTSKTNSPGRGSGAKSDVESGLYLRRALPTSTRLLPYYLAIILGLNMARPDRYGLVTLATLVEWNVRDELGTASA